MPDLVGVEEEISRKDIPEELFWRRDGVGSVLQWLEQKPVVLAEGIIGIGKTSFLKELDRQLQANNQKPYFFDCNRYKKFSPYLGPGEISKLLEFDDYMDDLSAKSATDKPPILLLDNGDSLYGFQSGLRVLDSNFSTDKFLNKLKGLIIHGKLKLVVTLHKPEHSEEYSKDENLFNLFQKTFANAKLCELRK